MGDYIKGVDEAIEDALCDYVRPRVFLSLIEDAVPTQFTVSQYKHAIRTATYEASTMNYTEMCDYLKERDGER